MFTKWETSNLRVCKNNKVYFVWLKYGQSDGDQCLNYIFLMPGILIHQVEYWISGNNNYNIIIECNSDSQIL